MILCDICNRRITNYCPVDRDTVVDKNLENICSKCQTRINEYVRTNLPKVDQLRKDLAKKIVNKMLEEHKDKK